MKFAFLVHPRDLNDVFKKYPLLKILPKRLVEFFLLRFWPPVLVSKVTGLSCQKTGAQITGYIISIPMTARQMIENRDLARKRILDAIYFAKRKGVKIVGLGALTSSLTGGGLYLVDSVDMNITTGHAYTAYNVTKNIIELTKYFGMDKEKITVAIVGAAGSVGSTSAKILARAGYNSLLLVDLERKKHIFDELEKDIKNLNNNAIINLSHHVGDIKIADFILTATNAPEALVKADDLKSGAIVVDDAQPSDISPEVFDREDVLVIEAGVVFTPGIKSNFDLGLKGEFDNFCCMAELLILAANGWDDHYVVYRATLENVDEIAGWGELMNFKLGKFQNLNGVISNEKLEGIKNILHK